MSEAANKRDSVIPDSPPEAWNPVHRAAKRALSPIEAFLHIEASSGIALMVSAVLAMLWANSPWAHTYEAVWHTKLMVGVGSLRFEQDLHFVINDILMTIFFFVVGLEIRRETHDGELAELKRAALPISAAIGGMVVPALIYFAINPEGPGASGWGVPMATDIAFAVGILALLGKRVPAALRVLLLALAIIDDIGAILVIALFYSSGIAWTGLAVMAAGVLLILAMQRIGVRNALAYIPAGTVIWAGALLANIHPTIAGVIIGLLTPVRAWFGREGFVEEAHGALEEFKRRTHDGRHDDELVEPLDRIEAAKREALSPVVFLNRRLHGWVAFGIMPIFALANAGVSLGELSLSDPAAMRVALGVSLGLALGKPIGIVGTSWLARKVGLCTFPQGIGMPALWVLGCVSGIGFTMSLFIGALAFAGQGGALLGPTRLAVLAGSLLAGVVGLGLGSFLLTPARGAARTPREAEQSTEL